MHSAPGTKNKENVISLCLIQRCFDLIEMKEVKLETTPEESLNKIFSRTYGLAVQVADLLDDLIYGFKDEFEKNHPDLACGWNECCVYSETNDCVAVVSDTDKATKVEKLKKSIHDAEALFDKGDLSVVFMLSKLYLDGYDPCNINPHRIKFLDLINRCFQMGKITSQERRNLFIYVLRIIIDEPLENKSAILVKLFEKFDAVQEKSCLEKCKGEELFKLGQLSEDLLSKEFDGIRAIKHYEAACELLPPSNPYYTGCKSRLELYHKMREMKHVTQFPITSFKEVLYTGSGSFGKVFTVLVAGITEPLTIKISIDTESRKQLLKKISILKQLHHPNIIKFQGIVLAPPGMVMEYASHGSLADYLSAHEVPWSMRCKFAWDAAAALKYLHEKGVVHADISLTNFVVDYKLQVKLIDFGCSDMQGQFTTNLFGTKEYNAPELNHASAIPNQSTDVYAFGVVAWQIAENGKGKFSDKQPIFSDPTIPTFFKKLIQQCLNHDSKQRPTMELIEKELKNLTL